MAKHDFRYFFHEGLSNMFSHGFMSFAAIGITLPRSAAVFIITVLLSYITLVCGELGLSMKAFFDVPGETDPAEDGLLRQIERLSPEQRKALAAFLDTMTNQSQN